MMLTVRFQKNRFVRANLVYHFLVWKRLYKIKIIPAASLDHLFVGILFDIFTQPFLDFFHNAFFAAGLCQIEQITGELGASAPCRMDVGITQSRQNRPSLRVYYFRVGRLIVSDPFV